MFLHSQFTLVSFSKPSQPLSFIKLTAGINMSFATAPSNIYNSVILLGGVGYMDHSTQREEKKKYKLQTKVTFFSKFENH